jgi:hypothetical protein
MTARRKATRRRAVPAHQQKRIRAAFETLIERRRRALRDRFFAWRSTQ